MSNIVVIKKVERETIVLEDCYAGKFSPIIAIAVFIMIFLFTCGVLVLINSGETVQTKEISGSDILLFALIMGVCFTFIMGGVGACSEAIPAYEISIRNHTGRECRRIVVKTTPEKDQAEVCRAAQELEVKARAISKKERELEQIALKCK